MQLSDLDVRPLQLHILALMVAARYVAAQTVGPDETKEIARAAWVPRLIWWTLH